MKYSDQGKMEDEDNQLGKKYTGKREGYNVKKIITLLQVLHDTKYLSILRLLININRQKVGGIKWAKKVGLANFQNIRKAQLFHYESYHEDSSNSCYFGSYSHYCRSCRLV